MTKTPREIELKLELDADAVPGLLAHPLIAPSAGAGGGGLLTSVYFDTPDQALRAEGLSLRVRQDGPRRIQTLKASGGAQAGLFDRGEWESEIPAERPLYDPLRDTPVRDLLSRKAFERDLRPVFISRVERSTHPVALGEARLSVTIDRGEVRAGEARQAVCELEIELEAGEPEALFALAETLAHAAPLRLAVMTKADRGYALIGEPTPGFHKASPPSLDPAMSAAAAFQAIARSCLRHFFLNEALYIEAGHSEALHQMRVALRRLRAAISLMGKLLRDEESLAVKARLKEAAGTLGAARNLDVAAQDVLPAVAAAVPGEAGLERLALLLDQKRLEATRGAAAAVRSKDFSATLMRVAGWVECGAWRQHEHGRARDFAAALLKKRRKRLLHDCRDLTSLSPEERHAVRIAVKKLRYAAEFFQPLFGGRSDKSDPFITAAAQLQEILGILNDDAVVAELLAGLPAKARGSHERALGLVSGFGAGRRATLLDDAQRAVKAVKKARRFW